LLLLIVTALRRSRDAASIWSRMLDFRFAQHPMCPECGARQTQRALFGMISSCDIEPWLDTRGCCVTDDIWTCTACMHRW
jgi:hypothetical protein